MLVKKMVSVLVLAVLAFGLSSCAKMQIAHRPERLTGDDVSLYSLANGAVEVRIKVSRLTSRLWVSTELSNNSELPLAYVTRDLVQFEDPTCLEDQNFESDPAGTLQAKEHRLVRYTFKLFSQQKKSPEYERCRARPLRFKISGLTLGSEVVTPTSFTIEN